MDSGRHLFIGTFIGINMAYSCPRGLEEERGTVINDLKRNMAYRVRLNRTSDAVACRSFIAKFTDLAGRDDAESCNILGNIYAIDREDGWYWSAVPTDSRLSREWYHRALRADCITSIDQYLSQYRVHPIKLEMQSAVDDELSDLLSLSSSTPLYTAAMVIGDRYERGSIENMMYRLLAMLDCIDRRSHDATWSEQDLDLFSSLCTDLMASLRQRGLHRIAGYALDSLKRNAENRSFSSMNALMDVYLAMPDARKYLSEMEGLARHMVRTKFFKTSPGRNRKLTAYGTAFYSLGGSDLSVYCFSRMNDLEKMESIADGFLDGSGIAKDTGMAIELYRSCGTPSAMRKLGCMYW